MIIFNCGFPIKWLAISTSKTIDITYKNYDLFHIFVYKGVQDTIVKISA